MGGCGAGSVDNNLVKEALNLFDKEVWVAVDWMDRDRETDWRSESCCWEENGLARVGRRTLEKDATDWERELFLSQRLLGWCVEFVLASGCMGWLDSEESWVGVWLRELLRFVAEDKVIVVE